MLITKKLNMPPMLIYAGAGLLFLLAIALRVSLYQIRTGDYNEFVSQWYNFIQTHGGFAAFKYNFANYNVPYLYLLALTTYVRVPEIVAIKTISVLFDAVLAIFTYLILREKYRHSYIPLIGALVVVFAPTIFINSAAWGQSDATYTAFCLGSLYFLIKERPAWACIFFGLAISFKLQAIFFLPVLLILPLKRKLPLRYLAFIPLVYLLLLVPALIAGRGLWSLLMIYVGQIETGGVGTPGQLNGFPSGTGQFPGGSPGQFPGRGTGQFPGAGPRPFPGGGGGGSSFTGSFTYNAPSFYQWLPTNAPEYWKWIGILLAGLFVILVAILILRSKQQFTPAILLKVALVFALAIPFLLPEMHERYFFLADVLSILYAFSFPRFWYIAVIMQLCSLLSYAPYLLSRPIISLSYIAVAILAITLITFADLVLALSPYWLHNERS